MNTKDLKDKLVKKLLSSIHCHMSKIEKNLIDESVFSYVVYSSSGCRDLGVTLCTRSELEASARKGIESYSYLEINSSEWSHVNDFYECFEDSNEFVNRLYEIFYEEQVDDKNLDDMDADELWNFICDFFIDVIYITFSLLKKEDFFNKNFFEKDILFGLQFSDPDEHLVGMIEKTSHLLNSEDWHEKVMKNCSEIRKQF